MKKTSLATLCGIVGLGLLTACGQGTVSPGTSAAPPTATSVPAPPTLAAPSPTVVVPTATAVVPTPTAALPTPAVVASPTAPAPPVVAPAPTQAGKPAEAEKPDEKPGAAPSKVPAEIARAATAMAGLKSYRLKIKGLAGGEQADTTVEYVAPDRRRVVSGGSPSEGGEELIVIGSAVYLKQEAAWLKLEGETAKEAQAGAVSLFNFGELLKGFEGVTFTAAGAETLNGEPCLIFDMADGDNASKLWISTRDNTVRQMVIKSDDLESVVTLGEVNGPITIDPPV